MTEPTELGNLCDKFFASGGFIAKLPELRRVADGDHSGGPKFLRDDWLIYELASFKVR